MFLFIFTFSGHAWQHRRPRPHGGWGSSCPGSLPGSTARWLCLYTDDDGWPNEHNLNISSSGGPILPRLPATTLPVSATATVPPSAAATIPAAAISASVPAASVSAAAELRWTEWGDRDHVNFRPQQQGYSLRGEMKALPKLEQFKSLNSFSRNTAFRKEICL